MAWQPIAADAWRPRGISDLEPNAWEALRRNGSTSVVAGPGAGKTEFLAQRAAYLLETGLCRHPQQILAISFKSDAAANLAARVRERCPPELAARFTSLTFDAFTKSLVDRFQSAIPEHWRPTRPYGIAFLTSRQLEEELTQLQGQAPVQWRPEVAALPRIKFESEVIGPQRLTVNPPTPKSGRGFAIVQWWQRRLRGDGKSSQLTFTCLNRLAELLLRANPRILRALRLTYPFVFVDEFQDTTFAQYDFLLSVFSGGTTTVTSVGDHKQRIMAWAGARIDAFERFEKEFGAERKELLFNFRSSPELVRVQHHVARAIEKGAQPMQSRAAAQLDRDAVQIWRSSSREGEAAYLAQWISKDLAARNKRPRDYALLVRQRAADFELEFQPALSRFGLTLRNESGVVGKTTIQDLLVDPFAEVALSTLKLGLGERNPSAWNAFSTAVYALRGIDEDDDVERDRADSSMRAFLASLRSTMRSEPPSQEAAVELTSQVVGFLDEAAIRRTYTAYARNDLLDIMAEGFAIHFASCADGATDWAVSLDRFVGVDDIPMLTVHKSKGLEYDTVLCLGMDDQSWWSHSPGNPEGVATFFVSLSRAKQRAIFLFCSARGARNKVADLYQMLTDAGVAEVDID